MRLSLAVLSNHEYGKKPFLFTNSKQSPNRAFRLCLYSSPKLPKRLSRLLFRKAALSKKRYLLNEKEIYFSELMGIQSTLSFSVAFF